MMLGSARTHREHRGWVGDGRCQHECLEISHRDRDYAVDHGALTATHSVGNHGRMGINDLVLIQASIRDSKSSTA